MSATTVVSARVDEAVALRAAARIKAAGLTAGDVIKRVWENLAAGGEVPAACEKPRPGPLMDEFEAFQEALPPAGDWLKNLTDAQMNEMLTERYE